KDMEKKIRQRLTRERAAIITDDISPPQNRVGVIPQKAISAPERQMVFKIRVCEGDPLDAKTVKTLAEPTLVTTRGQPATFQAGGSYPVPVVTGQGRNALQGIDFVPFGTFVTINAAGLAPEDGKERVDITVSFSKRLDNTGDDVWIQTQTTRM